MKNVSLVAIDFIDTELTKKAIEKTLLHFDPKEIIVFSNQNFFPGSKFIEIESCSGWDQYNYLLNTASLNYVNTSHMLFLQWDSWAVDSSCWTDDYLKYDYIGAPWPFREPWRSVGNGGFSLRSTRLMEILSNDRFIQDAPKNEKHPEDTFICIYLRKYLTEIKQIKFAPVSQAEKFSFECARPKHNTFGFHGAYGMPKFLSEEELYYYLKNKRPGFRFSTHEFWQFLIRGIYDFKRYDLLDITRFFINRLNSEYFYLVKYFTMEIGVHDHFFNKMEAEEGVAPSTSGL